MRPTSGSSLVLALLLGGCGRDPLSWSPVDSDGQQGLPDLRGPADLTPPVDLAGPPDLVRDLPLYIPCSDDGPWQLTPIRIAAIRRTAGPDPRLGATEQLVVTVELPTACEPLGPVTTIFQPGNATDFVELKATYWKTINRCPPTTRKVEWMVAIPGGQGDNHRVVVQDGNFPTSGVGLMYARTACAGSPDCNCPAGKRGTVGEGGACVTDCSCQPGLSCVGHDTLKGERFTCRRPCNDLLDCRAPSTCQTRVADDAEYVCATTIDQCATNKDCPDGYACEGKSPGRACVDRRPSWSGGSCKCSLTCGWPTRCLAGGAAGAECRYPCRTDVDCPGGASQIYYVCNAATGICDPAGD